MLVLGCIGLMVLWATATSALLIYGSFAGLILLFILWGLTRIKRIENERVQRARQAQIRLLCTRTRIFLGAVSN